MLRPARVSMFYGILGFRFAASGLVSAGICDYSIDVSAGL